MSKAATKIIVASRPNGDVRAVQSLVREARIRGAEAIALLGSLTPKNAERKLYGRVLTALAEDGCPAFYIPGPEDAPFTDFLREAANFEIVYPHLRGVHGTFALDHGHTVWSGVGGTVEDDPHTIRDETESLRYPGWEVEYLLKFLRELKDYEKVFLFTSHPEHKGLHEKGSAILAGIIKTHNPRLVLIAGREQNREMIGTSQVIVVGSLAEGNYTFVDLRKGHVAFATLSKTANAA
jgi:Icc-related predicted phosphoesterase